jgi:phosphate transport system permease protein
MTTVAPTQQSSLSAAHIGTGRKVRNHLATTLITASFFVALVPLVWLLWTVVSKGWHAITRNGWFQHSQRNLTFTDPGGGAYHAIVGTAEQVGLCALISVPIALLVGIYLIEYGRGPLARAATFMVDILTGIPSIVAALFIYAVFIGTFHGQRAGWLVSLALVMLMIPVVVRTTE